MTMAAIETYRRFGQAKPRPNICCHALCCWVIAALDPTYSHAWVHA